jgi:starch phosphorylase
MKVETNRERHTFEVQVYFNTLDPKAARVELYAEGVGGGVPVRQEMELGAQLAGTSGGYTCRAQVPANRPASDYTARVIPHCDGAAVPLEETRILWQR